MKLRSDKYFIGGEDREYDTHSRKILAEQLILVIISLACVVFFLRHPVFLQKGLAAGKIRFVLSIGLFLVLSPFGAHLITMILSGILEKIKCVIRS